MGLGGDLSKIDLAAIFQTLAMNQQTGTLVVTDRTTGSTTSLFFDATGVTLVTSNNRGHFRLGQILVNRGIIDQATLARALDLQKRGGKRLGEILVDMGATTDDEIDRLVRSQIEEEIFELFLWKNAHFQFHEGDEPPRSSLDRTITQLAFDPNALLMEAARRIDDWEHMRALIPSMREILVLVEDAWHDTDFDSLDSTEKEVLDLLDGERDIETIARSGSLPRYEICRILTDYAALGKVRTLTFEELVHTGDRAFASANFERALDLFRLAHSRDTTNLAVAERLAQSYETIGESRTAAQFYLRAANLRAEQGDPAGSLATYEKAAELNPLEVEAQEGIFEQVVGMGDQARVLEVGKDLLRAYVKASQTTEAAELGRGLVERYPEDIALRQILINVHLDRRDAKAAADEYLRILELLEPRKRYAEMADICAKVVQLDPEREDIRGLIDVYRRRAERSVTQFVRRPPILVAAASVFLLLLIALGWYNLRARSLYNQGKAAETEKNWEAAVQAYQTVVNTYGWSFWFGAAAREDLELVEAKQERERILLANTRQAIDQAWRVGKAALDSGDLVTADREFRKLVEAGKSKKLPQAYQAKVALAQDKLRIIADRRDQVGKEIDRARAALARGDLGTAARILESLAGWKEDSVLARELTELQRELRFRQLEALAIEQHRLFREMDRARLRAGTVSSDLEELLNRLAESKLDNLEAREAQRLRERLDAARTELMNRIGEIQRLRASGEHGKANRRALALVQDHPDAALLEGVELILTLENLPPQAAVSITTGRGTASHTVSGSGEIQVALPVTATQSLTIEAAGFERWEGVVSGSTAAEARLPVRILRKPEWQVTNLSLGETVGGLVIADRIALVPSRNGNLYGFDPDSGDPLWTWKGSESQELVALPVCVRDVAYLGTLNDPHLLAVRYDRSQAVTVTTVALPGFVTGAAAQAREVVVVGTGGERVQGVPVAGGTAWSAPVTGAAELDVATDGERFFVGTKVDMSRGHLYALGPDGQPIWNEHLQGAPAGCLAVTRGLVLVGTTQGLVYAFEAASGHLVWKQPLGTGVRVEGGLAILGNRVAVAAQEAPGRPGGILCTLSLEDGSQGQVFGFANEPLTAPPLVTDGYLYVGTTFKADSGSVYAFHRQPDGSLLHAWSGGFPAGAPVTGRMAATDGWVVVVTAAGKLYGFRE